MSLSVKLNEVPILNGKNNRAILSSLKDELKIFKSIKGKVLIRPIWPRRLQSNDQRGLGLPLYCTSCYNGVFKQEPRAMEQLLASVQTMPGIQKK